MMAHLIAEVLELMVILIIIDVVISWLPMLGVRVSRSNPFVRFVSMIVDPLLDPIRRLLPPQKTGNLDFSPMIMILLLQFIAGLITH